MLGRARLTLAILALTSLFFATGCVTERTPRRSIEPTWSYQDTPEPMAYSEVWDRPAGLTEAQVAQLREDLAR
ncbi:MAG: hypothetical protein AAGA29_08380 [Planctomycetota bacterium]